MPSVVILCTGNSCRSILAEALWREETGGRWRCESAGTQPIGAPHPAALAVLEEDGISIESLRSQSIDEFSGETFDLAVTVCDSARKQCPVFPSATRTLHWPFPDPAEHLDGTVLDQQQLEVFRIARDSIRVRIQHHLRVLDLLERMELIIEQLPGDLHPQRRQAYRDLARRSVTTLDERAHWESLPQIIAEEMGTFGWDWNGIYLLCGQIPRRRLELGPAAGPPVCSPIEEQAQGHSGLCFDAVQQGSILVAADVSRWPGYISCDGESGLNTVAGMARPIIDASGEVVAVWDVDCSQPICASDALVMDALIEGLSLAGPPERCR